MAHKDPTQLARGPLLLLDYAARHGLDREALVRSSGMSETQLADPDSRVPSIAMVRLWREVIAKLDDDLLGLNVGKSVSLTQLGLVGYAMQHSRNLYDAINRLARYQRVLSEAVRFSLAEHADGIVLTWISHPALIALRCPVEANMTMLIRLARGLTNIDVVPLRVELPTPPPKNSSAFYAEFRCPVLFGCEQASLALSKEQVALATVSGDDTLVAYLDELASIAIEPLDAKGDSTTTAVRRTLWSLLPSGRPSIWRTARELGISVRTLQRRLDEEGSSFSRVLDTLRRDVSEELLAGGGQSVTDIAFLLGYSEPSAFHRANRRWRDSQDPRGMN